MKNLLLSQAMTFTTAGLADRFDDDVEAAEPILIHFGGLTVFSGQIETLDSYEDDGLLLEKLQEPGQGKVLVVDGGGSLHRALLGKELAKSALDNGWQGLILYGCVRHTQHLADLRLGILALAAAPLGPYRRSRGSQQKPVHFAGVTFRPGHYVYVDDDGVLVSAQKLSLQEL
jgi:regulator of ribonuclease activity A